MTHLGAGLAAVGLTAGMAGAETPAPGPTVVAPVIVPERRPPPVVFPQAWNFVQSHGAVSAVSGQIARWAEPVCVEVGGLLRDPAARIADHILAVAQSVGVELAGPGCRPNVEVLFSTQPQAVMDLVAVRRWALLGHHSVAQTQALKTVSRPVQAWYVTATLDYQGAEVVDDPSIAGAIGCAGEVFTHCLESRFKNALIVVDSGRLDGKPPNAVADYIAFLALSRPRSLDDCTEAPSILDLFAAACRDRTPPQALTELDRAYLKGLYTVDPRLEITQQRDAIASRMTNAKAPPGR